MSMYCHRCGKTIEEDDRSLCPQCEKGEPPVAEDEWNNTDEFAEIRELAEKATPGPWESFSEALMCSLKRPGQPSIIGMMVDESNSLTPYGDNWGYDARFISACRTEVPRLLAAVHELQAELAKHQESEFHPDWSLLSAARESLRENCAEAKKQLAAKDAEIERLREALRALHDEQNGPPLARRAAQWEAAMSQAKKLLP